MQILFIHTSIVAVVATSLMTMVSYVLGSIRKKKFSEPELLNDLIRGFSWKCLHRFTRVAGWCIHYLVGFIFIVIYQVYWNVSESDPTIVNGVVLGAISGIVGICGWKLSFFLHPNPPQIDFKEYYLQLFLVHVVFGLSASITFKLITNA
jgi:hypothetical protein